MIRCYDIKQNVVSRARELSELTNLKQEFVGDIYDTERDSNRTCQNSQQKRSTREIG